VHVDRPGRARGVRCPMGHRGRYQSLPEELWLTCPARADSHLMAEVERLRVEACRFASRPERPMRRCPQGDSRELVTDSGWWGTPQSRAWSGSARTPRQVRQESGRCWRARSGGRAIGP
jgi:hypothetical protein